MKIAKLPLQRVEINEIVIDTYNPRLPISLEYKDKIREKINDPDIGFIEPLVMNINAERKNILISGHVRLGILIEEGFTEVDVSTVNLDEKKEKELNIFLNKVRSRFDTVKLLNIDEQILLNAGFSSDELLDLKMSDFSDIDNSLKERGDLLSGDIITLVFKIPKEEEDWVREICIDHNYDLVSILRQLK
jgi:ParB-like chromosome segregation protein Spo0J